MKVLVAGLVTMRGNRKSDKSAYSMVKVGVLQPVENVNLENMQKLGYGYEYAELACEESAVTAFAALKFPAFYDLKTDMRLRAGRMEPIVTGLIT